MPTSMYGNSIDDKVKSTGGSEILTGYSGKPAEVCPGAVPQVEARARKWSENLTRRWFRDRAEPRKG